MLRGKAVAVVAVAMPTTLRLVALAQLDRVMQEDLVAASEAAATPSITPLAAAAAAAALAGLVEHLARPVEVRHTEVADLVTHLQLLGQQYITVPVEVVIHHTQTLFILVARVVVEMVVGSTKHKLVVVMQPHLQHMEAEEGQEERTVMEQY
jgi:hypothetical protein